MRFLALIFTTWIMSCLALSTQAQGQNVYGTRNLAAEIDQIVRNSNTRANVGIAIKSMKYGDMIYARNDKSLFVPASTLKIFTAEAALLYLGPNYKFPTRFVTDATATASNGKLYGNIYLINSGDPSLTYYDLADLMASLKSQQIQEIVGNVYIDNTAYDQVTTGPGWLWSDRKYCYGAPISASIINHNCLSFRVPHSKAITSAGSTVSASNSTSRAKKSVASKPRGGSRSCYVNLDGARGGRIAISGCLPKAHFSAGVSSVITDVMQYDKTVLQDLFQRYGIQVKGAITSGIASSHFPELARHESKPLKTLISNMLKMSDNIIAGSIFKKIGELYTHRPGTWESGGDAVTRILAKQADIDNWRLNLIDGSGLSRYNQVTPSQMLQLLDFTYHNDATNYEFISALPIAGVDGTLKKRMRNIAWKVRAKTGTMKGVVSLAGYAMSADKEPFAFVILEVEFLRLQVRKSMDCFASLATTATCLSL
jgi:D-alanyl-D-alanine carboxypeptidase/D-alanyl-D-alanine-endopeptidase (penicillin-binding protein 4)